MNPGVSDSLIQEMLDSIEVTEAGTQLSDITNHQRYQIISTLILKQLLEADGNRFSKRLKGLRYTLSSEPFFGPFPLKVARKAKLQGVTTLADFKLLFEGYLQNIAEEPLLQYRCLIPVNVTFDGEPNALRTDDVCLNIVPYSKVADLFDQSAIREVCTEAHDEHGLYSDFSGFSIVDIRVRCRNSLYAEAVSSQYTNFVLGLVTLLLTRGHYSMRLMGEIGPIIDLNYGFCFVFENFENSEYKYAEAHNAIKTSPADHKLSLGQISSLNRAFELFHRASRKMQATIIDAVEAYHAGATEKRPGFAFFFFWTCVELLCLKEASIREVKVKERLGCIHKDKSPPLELELERFYSLRNKLVHTSEYSTISEFDRDRLKFYTENLLLFFLSNLMEYRKDEINDVYEYLCLGSSQIERRKRTVEIVEQIMGSRREPSANDADA